MVFQLAAVVVGLEAGPRRGLVRARRVCTPRPGIRRLVLSGCPEVADEGRNGPEREEDPRDREAHLLPDAGAEEQNGRQDDDEIAQRRLKGKQSLADEQTASDRDNDQEYGEQKRIVHWFPQITSAPSGQSIIMTYKLAKSQQLYFLLAFSRHASISL